MAFLEYIKKFQAAITSIVIMVTMATSAFYWIDDKFEGLAQKSDIAIIRKDLDEITGANRITQYKTGYSFVKEPVFIKDRFVQFHGYGRRTERGSVCIVQTITPLYEDEAHTLHAGRSMSPKVHIGTTYVPIKRSFDLPDTVPAGRIGFTMQYVYDCGNESKIENTPTIFFELSERFTQ